MKRIYNSFFWSLVISACTQPNTSQQPISDSTGLKYDSSVSAIQIDSNKVISARAFEAVVWGMPAVNYDMMLQATIRDAKSGYGQIVYWPKLQDWHNQTLTPNPDVIYFMGFFNIKESGPMVLEIPPAQGGAINGSVMDCWQNAIEDVGPAGVDKGKGGKYLIISSDYHEKIPAGYIPMLSDTYQGFFLLRSILNGNGSDTLIVTAVNYGKRIKLYPFSHKVNPMATGFVDVSGKLYDATLPYDLRFYQSLDRMIQKENYLTRDKAMISQLKSIGIVKGIPFNPDARLQAVLNKSVKDAHAWIAERFETVFQPYFEGTHWIFPATPAVGEGMMNMFSTPNSYDIDGRAVSYHFAFFSAKHIGAGQYYLLSIKDNENKPLESTKTYQLTIPAHAPVTQYWSATVYNRETHTLIKNAKVLSRSSQSPGLQTNPDGSVDLFFGSHAPSGKESNLIETGNGKYFEVLMRFYGPEKPLFDKTWKMPDIKEIK